MRRMISLPHLSAPEEKLVWEDVSWNLHGYYTDCIWILHHTLVAVSDLDGMTSHRRKECKLRGGGSNDSQLKPGPVIWGSRVPKDSVYILLWIPIHAGIPWVRQKVPVGHEIKTTSSTSSLRSESESRRSWASSPPQCWVRSWSSGMLICGPSHLPWPRVHGRALSPAGGLVVPRTTSWAWACLLQKEEWRALFLPCRTLQDRPCIVIVHAFSESLLPPPPLELLLLCNCSGSQDSWNLTSRGAIFNFSAHHSWALSPHTGASTAAVSSPLRVQTENQCCAYSGGGTGGGRPSCCPSTSQSTQLCSLPRAAWQYGNS